MISLSEIGGLYQSTPANLRDARTKAFMFACDRQIAKLLERAEKTKVWCAVESVDEKYLDLMAAECRALFYDSFLSADIKRKLIDNTLIWYMNAGTSEAVGEMVAAIFGEGEVKEWFEYGGRPYCFKIETNATITGDAINKFNEIIKKIKNVRSHLEAIAFKRRMQDDLFVAGCLKMIQKPTAIREENL